MCETGTLTELNVKPGDVVECIDPRDNLWSGVKTIGDGPAITDNEGDTWGRCDGAYTNDLPWVPKFRIISRAPDAPKTWGEMTDAERGALLLAAHEGKAIEVLCAAGEWGPAGVYGVTWNYCNAYRIKPEPKRETRDLYIYKSDIRLCMKKIGTIDILDGEPDWGSARPLEKL